MSKDAPSVKSDVRLRIAERSQVVWKAECLDELLPPQHRARTIWAVVESLDLSGFREPIKARQGVCGRDSTDPRILVSLWLYANTRGIGSARELARLCTESRPYQWLCGGVGVNHRLLSDFRTDHGEALDGLFTDVIATLVKKGLVTVRRISQDGLRVRASAGPASFRRGSTLEKLRAEAAEHVEQLRALLEDPARSAGLGARHRAARARAAKERLERIDEARKLIPKLRARQQKAAKRLSQKQRAEQQQEPRASTSDGRGPADEDGRRRVPAGAERADRLRHAEPRHRRRERHQRRCRLRAVRTDATAGPATHRRASAGAPVRRRVRQDRARRACRRAGRDGVRPAQAAEEQGQARRRRVRAARR